MRAAPEHPALEVNAGPVLEVNGAPGYSAARSSAIELPPSTIRHWPVT